MSGRRCHCRTGRQSHLGVSAEARRRARRACDLYRQQRRPHRELWRAVTRRRTDLHRLRRVLRSTKSWTSASTNVNRCAGHLGAHTSCFRPEHASSTTTSMKSSVAATPPSGDHRPPTLPPFCDGLREASNKQSCPCVRIWRESLPPPTVTLNAERRGGAKPFAAEYGRHFSVFMNDGQAARIDSMTTDAPNMTTNKSEKKRGYEEGGQKIELLRAKWPKAFPAKSHEVRPLTNGAQQAMVEEFGWSPDYARRADGVEAATGLLQCNPALSDADKSRRIAERRGNRRRGARHGDEAPRRESRAPSEKAGEPGRGGTTEITRCGQGKRSSASAGIRSGVDPQCATRTRRAAGAA